MCNLGVADRLLSYILNRSVQNYIFFSVSDLVARRSYLGIIVQYLFISTAISLLGYNLIHSAELSGSNFVHYILL